MGVNLHSLRWRWPLLVCAVVAAVLGTFLWAAYIRVQATLLQAAGERAQVAADQIAGMLDGTRSQDQLRAIGSDPVLRRFLEQRTDETREAAQARLGALAGTSLRRVELWDSSGTRLLEAVFHQKSGPTAGKALPPGSTPLVPGVHDLQAVNDIVFSDLVAEFGGPSGPIGFLLIRTTFTENPPGAFSRLVGRDARVRVGNQRGDVWTNFSNIVPAPKVDLQRHGVAEYQDPEDGGRVGAIALVGGVPLAVWVEFPVTVSTAAAQAFLRQMIPVALGFLAIAAVMIGVLTARITRPLAALSAAAEAISSGDYSQRIAANQRDEIGQLGRSFNLMAGQIHGAQQRLEALVDERTARLTTANSELEAFSYSVSHDLRAPLRSIDGFSLALLEDAGPKLNDDERKHLERVRAAAQRMARLIDDLLALARIARTELHRSRADLSAMAQEVANELRAGNPNRQVAVEIEEDLVVYADRGLLQILLENLFGNAWKFTARSDQARVRLGRKEIDDHTVYFVQDNGVGFDMAYGQKLFQPFQRLHAGPEFPGTGIGLATVRRIIERHRGRIWAEGTVGSGATVFFTLPEQGQ